MHRQIALGALLLVQATAVAQLGNTIRRILNGDSLAPPSYDTAYVRTYRDQLTLSLVSSYNLVNVHVTSTGRPDYVLSTNSTEQYGAGLSYKWLSAEGTINVPALDRPDPQLGNTRARSFGLGFTGRRIWLRGFWNSTRGFYLNDPDRWLATHPEGTPYLRGDLTSRTYMVAANYALSKKRRYTHNGALFQEERQKRSAGTFVAGISGWITTVRTDSSLLAPALLDTFGLSTGFDELKRTVVGASIGYTHTFSFWHKGFLQLSVLPGLTYTHQRIGATSGPDPVSGGVGSVAELRSGLGYNGDRWYASVTTAYYYSASIINEEMTFGTMYGFVRGAIGIRIRAPHVRGMEKLGL